MSGPCDVLCAGIVVADHVCAPVDHVPAEGELVLTEAMLLTSGGCAANAAVALRKMGVAAAVAGRVGDDAFGPIVKEMLAKEKVDTSLLLSSPGQPTSQTMIVNVMGEDRRFIHIFGANAVFTVADIPFDRVRQCKVLYIGGYLLMPGMRQNELMPLFKAAQAAGVKTVLDVGVPGRADYLHRLDQLLPHVDVFLPNNDEGALILNEPDPVQQALAFHQMGAKNAVVTLGGDGAVLVNKDVRVRAGVYPVDYVDGSGSGDAFDAGFICGLLRGLNPIDCLKLASALGASCVRGLGTTSSIFSADECADFQVKHALKVERV
jgi:sugar/nucleoside kinase (ribokinase family)